MKIGFMLPRHSHVLDKTILCEVILFKQKWYHIKLDKLYTNACYLLLTNTFIINYICIDINIFRFYGAMKEKTDCKLLHEALRTFMQFSIRFSFRTCSYIKSKNIDINALNKYRPTGQKIIS